MDTRKVTPRSYSNYMSTKKTLVGVETALKIELVTHQKSINVFVISFDEIKNWKSVSCHSHLHLQ